ncbi:MAG: 16S rRNA (cytidine(1402)-2'-O)-methyltransferase [Microbacteriaceae bacterium]|nr:16S rRNA (cytidine(1402)-2'-O)-methyltransferase [Microbacteriaceae bacterium]
MIILAATPIGNLGDASRRLVDALEAAEIVVAEDTRVAIQLMRGLQVKNQPKLVALHEHNEEALVASLVEAARTSDLLVVTDAGMPTISDPGYRLVVAATKADVPVTVLPGPSAVLTALALSGLPTDRFVFDGFVPRKSRRKFFAGLAREERTMVFLESPNRLAETLSDLSAELGEDRKVAVARELTKLHEEVRRGTASELADWARGGVRGEICLVVEGAKPVKVDFDSAARQVRALVASGKALKEAAAEVSEVTGHSKRELYESGLQRQ